MKGFKVVVAMIFFSYSTVLLADSLGEDPDSGLINADMQILNWDEQLSQLKTKTHLHIVFPTQIPADKDNAFYYVYGEVSQGKVTNYTLSASKEENCEGKKVCTVGFIRGEEGATPENYTDRNNQPITQPVTLSHHIQGYFTPAHAMGDFWPGQVSWKCKNTLYTLSWNLPGEEEKDLLIEMANSSIEDAGNFCLEKS